MLGWGALHKTLTVFTTKICVFLLTVQKFDSLSMTVAADTVALNINYEGILLTVLSIKMKR